MLSPIVAENPFVQDAHLYEPICLGPNIEKHASQPLYPEGMRHPHPDYINYKMLEVSHLSKEMEQIKLNVLRHHQQEIIQTGKHWLDFVKVRDIKGDCPKKIAFEKILAKNELSTYDDAMMYNHCKHSIFAAAKRQMKRAPKPDPQVADDFVKFGISILEGTCPEHLKTRVPDKLKHFKYSFQQWYNHNPKHKQDDIDKYMQIFDGKSHLTEKEYKTLNSDIYTGICKQEIQPTDGKSRMVCSIPIKTKVTMGPVTWKLEEIMAKHFPGYCGNKNLQEMTDAINKILDEGFTKIVEGDGSAFDNTQDVTLKEVDRHMYRMIEDKIYHIPKSQFHQISQAYIKTMDVNYIQNKKKKRLFRYKILGSVFSGDCDTTLCNTMRMALYNLYVNEKAGLKYGKDYKLFSKGDDFTVFYKPYITNQQIKEIYYKYFLKTADGQDSTAIYGLGQVLKFITIGGANTLSFCSLRSFYTDESESKIILVRDFAKFTKMTKYSRKIKTLKGKERAAYLLQQAISLRATYKGISIFEDLASCFENEARIYTNYCAKGDKKKAEQMLNEAYLFTSKLIREARKRICEYAMQETPEEQLIYDIGPRKIITLKKYKGLSYWETVKIMQEKASYNLNKNELKYINQQIMNEIYSEEFKATMGLQNLHDETKIKYFKK